MYSTQLKSKEELTEALSELLHTKLAASKAFSKQEVDTLMSYAKEGIKDHSTSIYRGSLKRGMEEDLDFATESELLEWAALKMGLNVLSWSSPWIALLHEASRKDLDIELVCRAEKVLEQRYQDNIFSNFDDIE